MSTSRTTGGLVAGVFAAGLLVAVPAATSNAAKTGCPSALPTTQAVDGLSGTGYTVEKGTKAEPFSAKVLGRITDGIAPGVDMIMADLESPALERAGGVWSGMSGSPVYTADGKLIGSVSYTLTTATKIAGITPAADMLALKNDPANARTLAASTRSSQRVNVAQAQAARIARTGEASKVLAAKGFQRLSAPITATGLARRTNGKFLRKIEADSGTKVRTAGATAGATAKSSPSEIFPGSNYVAALSSGDVAIYGLGTTTFVCDETAVAFGHPLLSSGPATYGVHPASALLVQPDPVFGPFKVGNPGGVVGTVSWDGTVGLRSTLGQAPEHQFPITTALTNDQGKTVKGRTVGMYQPWAPDIAASHLQAAIVKALGAQAAGSADVEIVVRGTTESGKKFRITHQDYFADQYDVSFATADSLYYLLQELTAQPFESLAVTGIDVKGSVSTNFKQYRVSKVETKEKGKWVALKEVTDAAAGAGIPVRATLKGFRNTDSLTVALTVPVPDEAAGATGSLTVSDGRSATPAEEESGPQDLDELIEHLNNLPSSNQLVSRLDLTTESGDAHSSVRVEEVQGAIDWYSTSVPVSVAPQE